jgi:protein phosphatase inhibitor 2
MNDHVKFDEEVIAEHDLDRGTRMKIDEPKTPYAEDYIEESEASGIANANGNNTYTVKINKICRR